MNFGVWKFGLKTQLANEQFLGHTLQTRNQGPEWSLVENDHNDLCSARNEDLCITEIRGCYFHDSSDFVREK